MLLPLQAQGESSKVCIALQLETTNDIGKLNTVQSNEADGCVNVINRRLCVMDSISGLRFLIDTGANVSVIPRSCRLIRNSAKSIEYKLFAANSTVINTYGVINLELNLGLRRSFKWTFIIADVTQPIIGADFLFNFKLLVDVHAKKLVDKLTKLEVDTKFIDSKDPSVKTIDRNHPYFYVLEKFPELTKPLNFKVTPRHSVTHYIETKGPPVHARSRPLAQERYKKVRDEFKLMQELGICRPSTSAWSSPLHVVSKKDGGIRPCGDYRALNAVTIPDRYPIPHLKDFTFMLANKCIFSRIDVNRAYHHIRVATEHVDKTAITTPFGLYEFPCMTFGLRNAAQTFQRFMDNTVLKDFQFRDNFSDTSDFYFCYLDDILVASSSLDSHKQHLEAIFSRLDKYGLTINLAKCSLGQQKVEFLGYEITSNGLKPLQSKVQAILDFPRPQTVVQLRRFIGMVNFYRQHMPKTTEYQSELNKYLHNSKKNDRTVIEWNETSNDAFEKCKTSLQNAATLAFPITGIPLAIMCDASDKCVGATLQQCVNNNWVPLAYFSVKMTAAQQKYSTYDKELLAIYLSVQYFRQMFEGRDLIIYTDHKPLAFAFSKLYSNKESPRRTRQLLFISEFTTDIRHVSGDNNKVADALSRVETVCTPNALDFEEIANEQCVDNEL